MNDSRPFWKKYFWVITLGFVFILGAAISFVRVPVSVTEAEAQALLDTQLEQLNAQNPDRQLGPVILTFHENSMTIDAEGSGNVLSERVSAHITAEGSPDYERKSIYFRATDFEVSDLRINGLLPPEALPLIVERAAAAVGEKRDAVLADEAPSLFAGAKRAIANYATDAVIQANTSSLQAMTVKYEAETQTFMQNMVVHFLQNAPLYTLGKDSKEQLAAAVLSDLSIQNGELTAVLSGARLMQMIIALFAAIAISIAWGVMLLQGRSSGFGLAIDVLDIGIDIAT